MTDDTRITPEQRIAAAERAGYPRSSIDEAKRRLAGIAATAEHDIDEGRIKLTGEAADRELARLAEVKHATATEVQVDLPAGFVPSHVFTNRTTKAVTFNGGELRRTLQHSGPVAFPTEAEAEALAFCFRIALEHDHGGAKRLRRLLFAWHNAAELGGFDFSDLWSLDGDYLTNALAVIKMIARSPQGWYAEHYGYAADMTALIETYGPIDVGDRVEGERWRDISASGRVVRVDDRARVAHVEWDGGGRTECATSELRRL